MRRVRVLLAAAWLLVPAACHEIRLRSGLLPAEGEELPILHRVSGTFSREDRPMRLVIRDTALLAQVPLVDVPVDFREQMLLVVTLGRRLSDRYRVEINRVWREGPVLRVDYAVTAPPPDAEVSISSPFCIAVVPRCDLNVEGFSPELPRRGPRIPQAIRDFRESPG